MLLIFSYYVTVGGNNILREGSSQTGKHFRPQTHDLLGRSLIAARVSVLYILLLYLPNLQLLDDGCGCKNFAIV
jgi:hypothetical protein